MARPPKVDHVRDSFLAQIASATNLVTAIQALPRKVHPAGAAGVHPKHVHQVVGLAFMGIIAAWEEFLERSLVRYVAGATTNGGYSPPHKHGRANDLRHAYEILSRDVNYDPQKHYLKVTDPKWVWRTADFFFRSHRYGCLDSRAGLLKTANSIRNRIAHDSEKCKADFREAARSFLNPPDGKLKQGFGPGALLLAPVQRHFDQPAIEAGHTHFESYVHLYNKLAKAILITTQAKRNLSSRSGIGGVLSAT